MSLFNVREQVMTAPGSVDKKLEDDVDTWPKRQRQINDANTKLPGQ